jgi:hypothetical protein
MIMNWKNVKKIGKGVIGVILVFIFMSSCFVKSKFDNPTDGFGGLLLEGASLLFAVSEGNITVSGILKDSNGSIIASGILDIARSGSASIQQRASADSKVYSDANGKFSMNIYQGSFTIKVSRADGTSVGSFSIKVSSATATPEVLSSTGLQVSGLSAAPVGGTIVTNTISLGNVPTEINEGASKTITVKLSVKSSATITLQVTSDCGCFDFNGNTTGTLTFTSDNSTIEQNLVITSLIDSNTVSEVGKISFTSSDLETTNISITNKETGESFVQFSSNTVPLYSNGDTIKVKLKAKPYGTYSTSFSVNSLYTGLTLTSSTLEFLGNTYNIEKSFISLIDRNNLLLDTTLYLNSQNLTIAYSDNGINSSEELFLNFDKPMLSTLDSDYIDNGDGTIKDLKNNLIWQKCTADTSETNCLTNTQNLYFYSEAISYCDSLNINSIQKWRLPTRYEIYSLLDFNNETDNPTIHNIFKDYTESSTYWSSSSIQDDIRYAWVSVFFFAYETEGIKETNGYFVRCVSDP